MSSKSGNYVDGFVLPIPKKHVSYYKKMATSAGKIWKDHGALEFRECVGDDLNIKHVVSFPKITGAKKTDTVFFSYIVYKSKGHRDKVNANVMKDPRIAKMITKKMPFDMKRMAYGGFKVLVKV